MMFSYLASRIAARKERREKELADRGIVEHAWKSFAAKYPGREILRNWPHEPKIAPDGGVVVTVVWNSGTKPPSRSWWRMGDAPEELSHDAAAKLISIPVWR